MTTLGQLNVGDKFSFAFDGNKKTWIYEVVESTPNIIVKEIVIPLTFGVPERTYDCTCLEHDEVYLQ